MVIVDLEESLPLDSLFPPFWKFPNTLPDNLTKISKSGKKRKEKRPEQNKVQENLKLKKSKVSKEIKLQKERKTRFTKKKTLKLV